MDTFDWQDVLGWDEQQITEIRSVAYSYLRQGKYEIARDFFEALLVIHPGVAYDQQTLGALYLELGEAEKAIVTLKQACENDPRNEIAFLNLAKAFLEVGEKRKAITLVKKLSKSSTTQIRQHSEAILLAHR